MSGRKPSVYWDSCIFLALIKDEKREAGEMEELEAVALAMESGNLTIMTSTITRVEVLSAHMNEEQENTFARLCQSDKVNLIAPDTRITNLASDLRSHYVHQGHRILSTPDAIHLATAINYNATAFHTFDSKGRKGTLGLIPLSGDVAGHALEICRPRIPELPPKRRSPRSEEDTQQKNLFDEIRGENTAESDGADPI